jgi:hypothetical protein
LYRFLEEPSVQYTTIAEEKGVTAKTIQDRAESIVVALNKYMIEDKWLHVVKESTPPIQGNNSKKKILNIFQGVNEVSLPQRGR